MRNGRPGAYRPPRLSGARPEWSETTFESGPSSGASRHVTLSIVMRTYDFVIVGAGSAGCVLAHRLSASGRHSVLVIEAGGSDRRFWLRVPIGYGKSFYDPRVNWMYLTEPEPSLGGRQGYWPRGKVLGGSSAINAMVFIRGHRDDFDDWAAAGNTGWGWNDVLPYFRRMESSSRGASEWRGGQGPLAVTDVAADLHPLVATFVQAGIDAGFPRNDDFNGRAQEGVGPYEITTRRGRRESAATAYLAPALRRPNVTLLSEARAERIVLEGGRAVGVEVSHRGRRETLRAVREVIVAAGAIESPLLLQRTGIGPAPLLQSLGIAVAAHSPCVGRQLQDHLCIDYLYRSRVPTLNDVLRPWHGKLCAGIRYLLSRRGPLALSVNQAGGFIRSQTFLRRPNLQLYFSPLSYLRAPPGKRPLLAPDDYPGFLLSAQPCRPQSRGYVELASPRPDAAPRIVPQSLSVDHDLEELLEGAQLRRRLAATPALSGIIAEELRPGPRVDSRDALIEDIRQRASTVFHPVGTCRLDGDPATGVVDPALRVHGVDRLRVIDASVFPAITSGNTNAPVMMVAERGADLVLADAA
jgi:choline dehydrogenase